MVEVFEWRFQGFHKLGFTFFVARAWWECSCVVDVNATRRFGGGGRKAWMTYRKQQTAVQVQNGSKWKHVHLQVSLKQGLSCVISNLQFIAPYRPLYWRHTRLYIRPIVKRRRLTSLPPTLQPSLPLAACSHAPIPINIPVQHLKVPDNQHPPAVQHHTHHSHRPHTYSPTSPTMSVELSPPELGFKRMYRPSAILRLHVASLRPAPG